MGRQYSRQLVRLFGAAAIVATAIGCASPSEKVRSANTSNQITDSAELKELIAGNTFYGTYSDGGRWIEYYQPDGNSLYREASSTCHSQWYVREDTVCFEYPTSKDSAPFCFKFSRTGKTLTLTTTRPNGPAKQVVVDKIQKGDAEGLGTVPLVSCP